MNRWIALILIIYAVFLSACAMDPDPGGCREYEFTNGIITPHKEYVVREFREGTEATKRGVFRELAGDEYQLLVDIGFSDCKTPYWFFEDDYLYVVGIHLVRYDLAADDPQASMEKRQILPFNTDVISVNGYNDELLYIHASIWNDDEARHDEPKYYEVKRDGTGLKEIERAAIPE